MINPENSKDIDDLGKPIFNHDLFLNFFDKINSMFSYMMEYFNTINDKIENNNNSNLDKLNLNQNSQDLFLVENEQKLSYNDSIINSKNRNIDNKINFDSNNFPDKLLSKNLLKNTFDNYDSKDFLENLNLIILYILNNKQLDNDLNLLNQKLFQSILFFESFKSASQNFIDSFEKINNILLNNCMLNSKSDFDGELNNNAQIDLLNVEESFSFQNLNKFSFKNFNDQGDFCCSKNQSFLSSKRKRADSDKTEENTSNKALHYRPKREYDLKRKKVKKPKIFKIEKISNKRFSLRKGSKKYILKRIQYCWKSYFLKLILKLIPRRYDVIISKKFYQDHTKAFYIQLFKKVKSVKDLIADVIFLKKRKKSYRRKNLNLKNMGQYLKEIVITPERKAFNFQLLEKFNKKILQQTIQMNMIKYFKSKNYRKRIEVYNCKRYDEVDLIKFRKPIKFFYSFLFKNFKFSIGNHETRRSNFYIDNLLKNRNKT